MDWKPEEENVIRRYLLDDATMEERRQVEERLLEDDHYGELLMLIEGELIDAYASGAMSERQQSLFRRNFLFTPQRRESLAIAQDVVKLAAENDATIAQIMHEPEMAAKDRPADNITRRKRITEMRPESGWIWGLFSPGWKIATYAALALAAGLGYWLLQSGESEAQESVTALNQAYREQRPVEARITGFGHAPFRSSLQLGPTEEQKVDYVWLDRAKNILFGKLAQRSSPDAWHALGRYYLTQKEFDRAEEQFKKALALTPGDPQLHSDLGAALLGRIERDRLTAAGRSKEDLDKCFSHLNKALGLAPGMPEALFNRALLQQRERLRRQAREDWDQYLKADPDSSWAEEARQNLKEVEAELNKVSRRGEQLYKDFLAAYQAGNNERAFQAFSLSYSFNGNGIVEKLVDEFLTARRSGNANETREKLRALALVGRLAEEKTGDRFIADLARYYGQARPDQIALLAQARKLTSEAYDSYRQSNNDRAVELYEQSKRLFAQAGNTGEALFAESWIGHCHHQRADINRNLPVFTRLVPIFTEKKYRWMQANALCGLANGHEALGRLSQAIDDARQCGRMSQQAGDQIGLIRGMYLRGGFYRGLGRYDEALRLSLQGMVLSDETAVEIRYAISFYQTSSRSLNGLGLFEAARAFQQEVIRMAEETKSPRLTARAYTHMGLIYGKWKKYDEAVTNLQKGIAIGQALEADRTGQEFVHYALIHLGNFYREAGQFGEALAVFDQVKDFFQKSGRHIYLYAGSKGRLLALIAQGDEERAQAELEHVIALYEKYRQSIQEESNRNSFFEQEQDVYDMAVDFTYTKLADPKQALAYAELSRGRSLFDAGNNGWKLVVGRDAPELKLDSAIPPANPDEIRRQLPDGVQLVEYAALNDKLIAWVITKSRADIESPQPVRIALTDLSAQVKQYLALVSQAPRQGDQRWREQAMALHDILIRPVAPLLDKQKQLCIIPDKILSLVPFGALVERQSGRLLVEDYTLLYAASANTFLNATEWAKRKAGVRRERLLAVWNPNYDQKAFPGLQEFPPSEGAERKIESHYTDPVMLIGPRAGKRALLRELAHADVVHLASHYVPDPWSPMLSQMPLSSVPTAPQDGALRMYELYRLPLLRARLVILAACETRGEEYYSGEGPIGFSRPFETAGVPLVVASLWRVDAPATYELMAAFHHMRKQEGQLSLPALRAAQLEFLRDKVNYQHPYYWAAFITVGGYAEY